MTILATLPFIAAALVAVPVLIDSAIKAHNAFIEITERMK